MQRHVPNIEDFHVAWVTALPTEFSAATAMLDEQYEHSVDTALYTLGRIGWHNVVIVCLPAGHIGTTAAATTVLQMTLKFTALNVGFLIGVGAGVPSTGVDIRLGDVVISQPQRGYGGVVQYDFNKITPGGKHSPIGYLNGPPRVLLSALTMLKARVMMGDTRITSHLEALEAFPSFSQATPTPDVLFRADYEHIEGPTCEACRKDMAIERPKRGDEDMSIKLPKRVDKNIFLHYGIIASGNQVIRDGLTRDRLSTELEGVLCFEMEAAGLLNILPCIVIRGICDYGDSHKNKTWQPCAAGNAAACAKELLTYVPPFSSSKTSSSDKIERGSGTVRSPSRDGRDTIAEPSMKASTEKEQGAVFEDTKQEVGIDGFQPLEELLGLRQLYPSSLQDLPPGLDVIAVHGLGDSRSTWTKGTTLWLRDLLPNSPSFHSARIMTFGYDARSFLREHSSTILGRLFTFAEDLLNDLADMRASRAYENRPIIFICHSLGGLVVKSALRHANERRSLYGNIADSTKAILFFGTPHQGSDIAAYLTGFQKAILLDKTEFVGDIARWSAPLKELTTTFSEIAPNYDIMTFFEQRATKGVIVVPESSARMGQANERTRGLNEDHVSLCKFTGADSNWRIVSGKLEAIADSINKYSSEGCSDYMSA